MPKPDILILGDGLEFRPDGFVRKDGKNATHTDVPARYDLRPDHPMRGKRVLKIVPAGYPDCTVDDNGNLRPVDRNGDMIATVEE